MSLVDKDEPPSCKGWVLQHQHVFVFWVAVHHRQVEGTHGRLSQNVQEVSESSDLIVSEVPSQQISEMSGLVVLSDLVGLSELDQTVI